MKTHRTSSHRIAATVLIRVPVSAHQIHQLDRWAERAFCRRGALASKIIAAWLEHPQRDLIAGQVPCDLAAVCSAHHQQILQRQRIVLAWRKARGHRRRGQLIESITCSFIANLKRTEGIAISRATLFNWDNRFHRGGSVGLADGRRMQSSNATKRDDRTVIDGTSIKQNRAVRAQSTAGR